MKKYLFYSLLAIIVCGTAGLSLASAYDYGFWNKDPERLQKHFELMVEKDKITEEGVAERLQEMKNRHNEMLEAKASLLGLSAEDFLAKLKSGVTFREIVEGQNLDLEEVRNQMREQLEEKFGDKNFKRFDKGLHEGCGR